MRAIFILLIGCGTSAEPPPAPAPEPVPVKTAEAPPPCATIIRNAAQRILAESKRLDLATTVDRTAAVMTASCETEVWPTSVLSCISSARLDADLEVCTEELTQRQYKRLHDKIAAVTPPPPKPPAPVVVRRPPAPRPPPAPADDLLLFPPATAKLDCRSTISKPRDPGCIKQYCSANPTDARCMIE